jgi:hypothetical protein
MVIIKANLKHATCFTYVVPTIKGGKIPVIPLSGEFVAAKQ